MSRIVLPKLIPFHKASPTSIRVSRQDPDLRFCHPFTCSVRSPITPHCLVEYGTARSVSPRSEIAQQGQDSRRAFQSSISLADVTMNLNHTSTALVVEYASEKSGHCCSADHNPIHRSYDDEESASERYDAPIDGREDATYVLHTRAKQIDAHVFAAKKRGKGAGILKCPRV